MQRYRISSAAWKFSNTLRSLYLDKNVTRMFGAVDQRKAGRCQQYFFSDIRWYDNQSISYLKNTYNKNLHTVLQYQYLAKGPCIYIYQIAIYGSGPKWWWQPIVIYPPTVDDAWFHFEPWHGIPRHVQSVVFSSFQHRIVYVYICFEWIHKYKTWQTWINNRLFKHAPGILGG